MGNKQNGRAKLPGLDNDAFAERERLELKIRQLEAQLANSKKGSTCMLL